MKYIAILSTLFLTSQASAQTQPPKEVPVKESNSCPSPPPQDACPVKKDGGVCLSKEQKEELKKAVQELKDIHETPVELEVEPIIIIRDWEDRIYINGQDGKPLKGKIKIGETIDRDIQSELEIQVHYRPEPPPPMFRLRIRAQAGFLSTPLINVFDGSNTFYDAFDVGIGWDFFGIHKIHMNVAAYTGLRSVGAGVGFDITKNFGIYGGYSFIYQNFQSSGLLQIYFSFN